MHTINKWRISFDPVKDARNQVERGLSFSRAVDFDFETALYWIDQRKDYPEVRISALGWLDGRMHSLVFVELADGIRVISLRKANSREVKRYAQKNCH